LEFDCNQLGAEVDLDFFLSRILTLDFPLCQKCKKRLRGLTFAFLGTNTREMMNKFRILGVIVVAASFLTVCGF
jgi:hypothetical protein